MSGSHVGAPQNWDETWVEDERGSQLCVCALAGKVGVSFAGTPKMVAFLWVSQ